MELTKKGNEHDFIISIYQKAWKNSVFKQDLIHAPIETLSSFIGKEVNFPIDKKLVVEDQTNPNHIFINIPPKPNLEDLELSEEQLEKVAGGWENPIYVDWGATWDGLKDEVQGWFD